MIQSPFLRRILTILLAVLPEVYSFVECIVGLFVLTLILRWLGLADGTFARIMSTVWLGIVVLRWMVRSSARKKRRQDEAFVQYGYVLEHYAESLALVSVVPENPADLEPAPIRHEKALQGVITKTGMNREEVVEALKRYSL